MGALSSDMFCECIGSRMMKDCDESDYKCINLLQSEKPAVLMMTIYTMTLTVHEEAGNSLF